MRERFIMSQLVTVSGSGELDWFDYYESDGEYSEATKGRRERWDNGGSDSDDGDDCETIETVSTIESVETQSSVGSFIASDDGHARDLPNGRLSPGILNSLGQRMRRSRNIFDDFWAGYNRVHGSFRRKIVSSILDVENTREFEKVFRAIIQGLKKCNFGAICYHEGSSGHSNGTHIHVIHDCPWHSQRCKCFQLSFRRRDGKQHNSGEDTVTYVDAVLLYYTKDTRRLCYVKIGTTCWTAPVSGEGLQYVGNQRSSVHREIEEGNNIPAIVDARQGSDSYQVAVRNQRPADGIDGRRSTGKAVPRSLEQFILDHPTAPFLHVMETVFWQNSDYKYLLANDKVLRRAAQAVQVKLMNMSYDDFEFFYSVTPPERLVFQRRNVPFNDYYFTRERTLELIEEIINFQLNPDGDSADAVAGFFKNVYNVVAKKLPKINSLYVIGVPSSGKNWIFDSLLAFFMNTGSIANFNKFSNFPFNNCKQRRILCWNEPNTDRSEQTFDTCKMIFGGDPCPVNIKNQEHYEMPRTPVLILSNKDEFKPHKNVFFAERMITYKGWSQLPWPKVDKKAHPLFWIDAFHKYQCKK